MPMILSTVSTAAGASTQNLIAGSAFEYMRTRSIISMGWGESATGGFMTLQGGSDIIAEEHEPAILTRYPIVPDEFYFTDVLEQGDRLVARFRNTAGAALTTKGVVQISPA